MTNKIRQLSDQGKRVESGAVQFGDDWPSYHLRGDEAFNFVMQGIVLLKLAVKDGSQEESFENLIACNTFRSYLLEMLECNLDEDLVEKLTTAINNIYNPTQV